MAVTDQIFATWRRPAQTYRRLLAAGPNEARALAILMGGCLLAFVAQTPALSRAAELAPDVEVQALMGIRFFVMMFLVPPLMYLVAGLSHLGLRLAGRPCAAWRTRIVLFWTLLALAPAVLLQGLVAGLVGPGAGLTVLNIAIFALFLLFWFKGLKEAAVGGV